MISFESFVGVLDTVDSSGGLIECALGHMMFDYMTVKEGEVGIGPILVLCEVWRCLARFQLGDVSIVGHLALGSLLAMALVK